MKSRFSFLLKPLLPCLLIQTGASAFAELPVAKIERSEPVNFATEIYPFLKANCLACHNSTKAKADLILESPEDMLRGGDTGPAIEPGNADYSFLFTTAAHLEEPTMPPANNKSKAKNLTPKQLGLLKRWIEEGAKGDQVSTAAPESWTYLRGPQPIYTAALSQNGRFAASGRGQGVDIYDLKLGQHVASLQDPALRHPTAHHDLVQSVAFSRSGIIATGGFRTVKIWERNKSVETMSLALSNTPTSLAISPDHKTVTVGCTDGSILLIDTKEADAAPRILKAHAGSVTDLVFSHDGATLFSASEDKTIKRLNVTKLEEISSLLLPAPAISLSLINQGKYLLMGSQDQFIRICHANLTATFPLSSPVTSPNPSAKPDAQSPPEEKTHGTEKPSVPASASKEGASEKPQPKPQKLIQFKLHGQPIVSVATVNSDGTEFVVGHADGTVIQCKFDPAKPTATPAQVRRLAHGGKLTDMAVSLHEDGGPRLATAGASGITKLWNLSDGKLIADLKPNPATQQKVDKLARETSVATRLKTHWDKKAPEEEKLWKAEAEKAKAAGKQVAAAKRTLVAKREELEEIQRNTPPAKPEEIEAAVKAHEEAERAVTGAIRNRELSARLAGEGFRKQTAAESFSAEADALLTALKAESETIQKTEADAATKLALHSLSFSPDGTLLAQGIGGESLRLWSANSGSWLEDFPIQSAPEMLGFIANQIVTIRDDKNLVLHALPGTQWLLVESIGDGKKPDPFIDRVPAIAFSPDGKIMATGTGVPSRKGDITIWDTTTWDPLASIEKAHKDTITSLVFSPNGDRIASSSTDQTVKIFESRTLAEVQTFEGHTNHVLDLAWNADNLYLASSGADHQVKIWDLEAGQETAKVEGFKKEVSSVSYVGDTDALLTASGDKTVKLSNAPLPSSGETFFHSADATPDGKIIIAGGQDGILRVWNAVSKKLINEFPSQDAEKDKIASE